MSLNVTNCFLKYTHFIHTSTHTYVIHTHIPMSYTHIPDILITYIPLHTCNNSSSSLIPICCVYKYCFVKAIRMFVLFNYSTSLLHLIIYVSTSLLKTSDFCFIFQCIFKHINTLTTRSSSD